MNRNEWLKRNQRTFCIMWKNKKKPNETNRNVERFVNERARAFSLLHRFQLEMHIAVLYIITTAGVGVCQ